MNLNLGNEYESCITMNFSQLITCNEGYWVLLLHVRQSARGQSVHKAALMLLVLQVTRDRSMLMTRHYVLRVYPLST